MALPHYTQIRIKKVKSDEQVLREKRLNKIRKIEGKPLIEFGPQYVETSSYKDIWEPIFE